MTDCEIVGCGREAQAVEIVTDRDGGGSPLKLCAVCQRAFYIARRDTLRGEIDD